MADSPRRRYSRSPSPRARSRSASREVVRSRSRSRERSRSRSRSRGREDAVNPGDTLYVTGLSSRVTERDLEAHFAKEGKVASCRLVTEPRTQVSRGFAFVTMENFEDAERCVKYLNKSVLEGRHITVEKSRRKRPRTPTPGNYLGAKSIRESGYRGDRGRYRGGYERGGYDRGGYDRGGYDRGGYDHGGYDRDDRYRRSPRRSPYRGGRDYSPRRSPYGGGGRSRRERSRSPIYDSPGRNYGRHHNVYAR